MIVEMICFIVLVTILWALKVVCDMQHDDY